MFSIIANAFNNVVNWFTGARGKKRKRAPGRSGRQRRNRRAKATAAEAALSALSAQRPPTDNNVEQALDKVNVVEAGVRATPPGDLPSSEAEVATPINRPWKVDQRLLEDREWTLRLFKEHRSKYQSISIRGGVPKSSETTVCLANVLLRPAVTAMLMDIAILMMGKNRNRRRHCSSFSKHMTVKLKFFCTDHHEWHEVELSLRRFVVVASGMLPGPAELILWIEGHGDASHLCGVFYCHCPYHLFPESHEVNCDRRVCHDKHDAGDDDIICTHKPLCIFTTARRNSDEPAATMTKSSITLNLTNLDKNDLSVFLDGNSGRAVLADDQLPPASIAEGTAKQSEVEELEHSLEDEAKNLEVDLEHDSEDGLESDSDSDSDSDNERVEDLLSNSQDDNGGAVFPDDRPSSPIPNNGFDEEDENDVNKVIASDGMIKIIISSINDYVMAFHRRTNYERILPTTSYHPYQCPVAIGCETFHQRLSFLRHCEDHGFVITKGQLSNIQGYICPKCDRSWACLQSLEKHFSDRSCIKRRRH